MKKILNYLPNWQNIKRFFNVIYYVAFFFWCFIKTIMVLFTNYVITTNDIFMLLSFIVFFLVDIYDAVKR
jgi:hypothetical protein